MWPLDLCHFLIITLVALENATMSTFFFVILPPKHTSINAVSYFKVFIYICVIYKVRAHMCVVVRGDQKRVSDLLKMELEACVSCLT